MRRAIAPVAALVVALWAAAAGVWADAWSTSALAALPRYTAPAVVIAPGVDVDQAAAAAVVAAIVNDPRGWRRDLGQDIVRIVTPGDMGTNGIGGRIGTAHFELHTAAVTADAWTILGPKFADVGGTLADQRVWIVNHELGHLIAGTRDHQECTGTGPAPVMRAVDYQLGACTLNVWPNP
jgi:hypothetical protein